MTDRPRRSVLYLPASNARALDKARGLDCDAVILDLEDAVAPESKVAARASAVEAVTAGGFGRRELIVRINPLNSEWGRDDLTAVAAARPDAILIPKVDGADDVAACRDIVGPDIALWAMIETARATFRLEQIACAGVAAMVIGTNDLAAEIGYRLEPDRQPVWSLLAQAVTAARIGGAAVLDGVFNALDDPVGLRRECEQAVRFGFDGKTVIHPNQIALCNAAFTPDAETIAHARRVVAAFADPSATHTGVVRVDGRMVERLHLIQAQRLLARLA